MKPRDFEGILKEDKDTWVELASSVEHKGTNHMGLQRN
jgi:hypothetical protein